MADIFTKNGNTASLTGTTLRGDVIPAISGLIPDGRKLILPWGCGDTQRKYPNTSSALSLYTPEAVATNTISDAVTLEQLVSLVKEGLTGVETAAGNVGSSTVDNSTIINQWQTFINSIGAQSGGIQGAQGPAGTDGEGAIVGSIETGTGTGESYGSMVWVRNSSLVWSPSVTTNHVKATFYRSGVEIATRTVEVTLDTTLLTMSSADGGGTGEDTSYSVTSGANGSMSLSFVHDDSQCTVMETLFTAVYGANGTNGENGKNGTNGDDAVLYYIKPLNGSTIKNSTGTLTLEAHKIEGTTDTLLSTGTIQLYDGTNPLGYSAELDSGDITGSMLVTLKDGSGGTVLDSITLVDVLDGDDGTDGITGVVENIGGANTLSWVQARNNGAWSPTTYYTTVKASFYQSGSVIGYATVTVTLTPGTAGLTVSTVTLSGVTYTVQGSSTQGITIKFTHTSSGSVVQETFIAVQSGLNGTNGENGISPSVYYLVAPAGTAIKNGVGTLTVQARQVVLGLDTPISSGSIRMYNAQIGGDVVGDGYSASFESDDIEGSITLYLKNGAYGTVFDTITLVDVNDGDQLSADLPITNGLTFTANSPSNGYVAWTSCTVLYKGTSYTQTASNTNKTYVYFDGTTGLIASTNTFADLTTGDRWPLGENSVTGGVSTWYPAVPSKYILAGMLRASTLSSIAANLGTITGGSITLTTTDGNTQWRLDSTGLAGRWKTGSVWGGWKYVAKIIGGKTVAAFDAYSTGEAIEGLGYMTIVGKTTVANDTGASNTWATGYRLRLSDTGYTTPYYDSSNSGKLFLSTPVTLQQYEQQIYFDESDGNELFICTYNNYSGVTLYGGMDIETFFILPSNEMILIDSIRQHVQNMMAAADRLTRWESVDTTGAGLIPMTKKIIYPTEYGITVGTTFKVGWRMKWFKPGLSGSQADLTWKGKIKIDTVGVGSQVVKV